VPFAYPYIGPDALRRSLIGAAEGERITSESSLREWIAKNPDGLREGCTFVVGLDGVLRLAPRRSEHVACAGATEVLAAGELRFALGPRVKLIEASNQSTGFCPDVDCWSDVERALSFGVILPSGFTRPIIFRRCPRCAQVNLVKEQWFCCVFCDADLPLAWNVSARRRR
jgi:hypothetical protein